LPPKAILIIIRIASGIVYSYLTEADWKAIAGEKETEALKKARAELNLIRAEKDRANHLLERRSEQVNDPSLNDDMA